MPHLRVIDLNQGNSNTSPILALYNLKFYDLIKTKKTIIDRLKSKYVCVGKCLYNKI